MSTNLVNIGSLRTIVRINFETRMRTHDSNIPLLSRVQREIDEVLHNREISDVTKKKCDETKRKLIEFFKKGTTKERLKFF